MSKLLAAALLLYSMHSHAALFCWNSSNNTAMTYQLGTFVYQLEDGTEPPPVVAYPGPQLLPEYYSNAYCYVDGVETAILHAALPDLHWPAATTVKGVTTLRKSLQHPDGIVYFTGDDAVHIINE